MPDAAQGAMAHVRHLGVDIGPRPSGSPGNEAAAEYIAEVLRGAGLAVGQQAGAS